MMRRSVRKEGLSMWHYVLLGYSILLLFFLWYFSVNSRSIPHFRSIKSDNMEKKYTYVLKIAIFGYDRDDSIRYLWERLCKTDFSHVDDVRIDIEFFIDGQNMRKLNHELQRRITDFLMGLKWDRGYLNVHRSYENMGLKPSIMTAWYPTKKNEFMIFLEDDIDVSRHWFRWVDLAIRKYYLPRNEPIVNFFGVSLYNQKFHEITWRKFQFSNGNKPFLFQMPMSWGACYFPYSWKAFRDWYYVANASYFNSTSIQKSHSNKWTLKSSWKRFATYYFFSHNGYMLYPNLPFKISFSTQRGIPGTHSRRRTAFRYIIPLLGDLEQYRLQNPDTGDPFDLPEWNDLKYLNIYAKKKEHPFQIYTPKMTMQRRFKKFRLRVMDVLSQRTRLF